MDELHHRLNALAFYARSPLQDLAFEPRMNWWRISTSNNLREQVKDSVHLLEQVGYTENEQSLGKVKLSVLLERNFGDKSIVVPYNKKLFVTVIGLEREEQADCPLPATLVRDQGEDKNKKWMDLKKIVVRAAEITFKQQKVIDFLKEADAKERAEALTAYSAAVSIETVTVTTTVSQKSTSSVITVVAAATTPLMDGHIFQDFLIPTHCKKLPIHDSIKKNVIHIAHEYTMNFRVKDTISFSPFNGGKRKEWTRAIKTKGGVSPRSVQRYMQRASGFVDNSLDDANLTVRDEVLKQVTSNVGPSLVKYKHEHQLIATSPEDQLLLQQTKMMSGRQMLRFNRILVGLTGISIHSTSTTITALQDKQMPDCTIYMVKLLVNKTMQPRRVFRVARWTQVIELRVSKLFENQVFIPSSSFDLLDDSTIIIRFGGDKRGKKMAFKWGLAVINAQHPSSSIPLDLLATMEAFDKYNNLRDAIFQHHVEESAVIFNTEVDPVIITIRAKRGIPFLVKVSECGLVDDPLLHDPVLCDRGRCPKFE
jgi:hypothetical protein